ncbi:MAG: hypothetical protein ACO1RT_07995 [Planctomycetaceae bacterium]
MRAVFEVEAPVDSSTMKTTLYRMAMGICHRGSSQVALRGTGLPASG